MTAKEARETSQNHRPLRAEKGKIDEINEKIKLNAEKGFYSAEVEIYDYQLHHQVFVNYFTKRGFEVTHTLTGAYGSPKYYTILWKP